MPISISYLSESLVILNSEPRNSIRSISDIKKKIREESLRQPPGMWIRGREYKEFYPYEKRHPNRRDLDAVASIHPIKLTHRSGRAYVLNCLALKQVGISKETGRPSRGFH
jgi:predicted amidohydrolase YtcJ